MATDMAVLTLGDSFIAPLKWRRVFILSMSNCLKPDNGLIRGLRVLSFQTSPH
jgi:hypothetical protein